MRGQAFRYYSSWPFSQKNKQYKTQTTPTHWPLWGSRFNPSRCRKGGKVNGGMVDREKGEKGKMVEGEKVEK